MEYAERELCTLLKTSPFSMGYSVPTTTVHERVGPVARSMVWSMLVATSIGRRTQVSEEYKNYCALFVE